MSSVTCQLKFPRALLPEGVVRFGARVPTLVPFGAGHGPKVVVGPGGPKGPPTLQPKLPTSPPGPSLSSYLKWRIAPVIVTVLGITSKSIDANSANCL